MRDMPSSTEEVPQQTTHEINEEDSCELEQKMK